MCVQSIPRTSTTTSSATIFAFTRQTSYALSPPWVWRVLMTRHSPRGCMSAAVGGRAWCAPTGCSWCCVNGCPRPHHTRWSPLGARARSHPRTTHASAAAITNSRFKVAQDLRFVVGRSKTVVCDTFSHALRYVYRRYSARLTSLLPWESYMQDFVDALQSKGSVYPNLIGLVDGHFQAFCRPGGPG